MNRRLIKKILAKKHADWCESITDEAVRKMAEKGSIITGGSIVSLLTKEPIKDFDIYFRDYNTCQMVAEYYVKKFNELNDSGKTPGGDSMKPRVDCATPGRVKIVVKSAGIASTASDADYDYFEGGPDENAQDYVEKTVEAADDENGEHIDAAKPKYAPVFLSANAITLSHKVQLVIRFFGEPQDIHKNYDFVHCMNYWTSWDGELVLHPAALESILARELQYMGSLYPLCSVIRTRKFLKRGWHINAGQYLKMCFQLSKLDLSDINVLEEQLTGVDAAYFHQVIAYCKQRQQEDPAFKPDTPYLVSIVDKIFG